MQSAAEHVYELLKQRLIGGAYAPGAALKEAPLAKELEVSRTPIRAALKKLAEDGLVIADRNRGVRAAEWTDADIDETYALRELLEGHAAALAAQRGGVELAEKLDALNLEMSFAISAGGDVLPEQLQDINARFHRAILAASGAPRLRTILSSLIDMPIILRSHYISSAEDKLQSLSHHRDLSTAVRAGDPELAQRIMQLHLRIAAHRFKRQRSRFRKE